MKKIEPKEDWSTALGATLGILFFGAVFLSLGMAMGWILLQVMSFLWSVSPFLPLVVIIPAAMVVVFRYTGLLEWADNKWTLDGTTSDSGYM